MFRLFPGAVVISDASPYVAVFIRYFRLQDSHAYHSVLIRVCLPVRVLGIESQISHSFILGLHDTIDTVVRIRHMDSIDIVAAAFTGSNSQGQARVYAGIVSRLDNGIDHSVPRVRRYTATASCGTVLGFLFGSCFFSGNNVVISFLHFFRRAVTQYADEPVVIIFPADLFDSVIVKKIGNGFFLVVGFVILVSFRSGVPGGSLGTFTLRTLERFQ